MSIISFIIFTILVLCIIKSGKKCCNMLSNFLNFLAVLAQYLLLSKQCQLSGQSYPLVLAKMTILQELSFDNSFSHFFQFKSDTSGIRSPALINMLQITWKSIKRRHRPMSMTPLSFYSFSIYQFFPAVKQKLTPDPIPEAVFYLTKWSRQILPLFFIEGKRKIYNV